MSVKDEIVRDSLPSIMESSEEDNLRESLEKEAIRLKKEREQLEEERKQFEEEKRVFGKMKSQLVNGDTSDKPIFIRDNNTGIRDQFCPNTSNNGAESYSEVSITSLSESSTSGLSKAGLPVYTYKQLTVRIELVY